KWFSSDSVGRRDRSRSIGSLKASGELSVIGRDATNQPPVTREEGMLDEVGSSFGEEE
ncbi:hypothetical protein KI387_042199, partial [Taxus chinensis]